MSRKFVRTLVLAALGCGLICAGCRKDQQKSVHIIGSTSVMPFAEELGRDYEKAGSGRKVDVEGGGSTTGIQSIENGLADIGTCSRELTPEEAGKYKQVVIARDGLAVVVHHDNPVSALTTEQIRGLFSGQIQNWKEVGGNDAKVVPITREEGSGTRDCFTHLIMGKEPIAREALTQESTGAVKALIKSNVSAIGYVSLGLVGSDLKMLKVDEEEATVANVMSGKYKLARPFLFVTKGDPKPEAKAFIDFVLSEESQKKLESEGLIRAK